MFRNVKFSNSSLAHLIYAGSFLFAVFMIISYLVWNKDQIAIQKAERRAKVENCINQAVSAYNNAQAQLCNKSNPNINCQAAIAVMHLNDSLVNKLNKDREICVEVYSN